VGLSYFSGSRLSLTPQQEHQMAFQPDMILQFAHFLEDEFARYGHADVRVTVDALCARMR
jgi:hypothetical protein